MVFCEFTICKMKTGAHFEHCYEQAYFSLLNGLIKFVTSPRKMLHMAGCIQESNLMSNRSRTEIGLKVVYSTNAPTHTHTDVYVIK